MIRRPQASSYAHGTNTPEENRLLLNLTVKHRSGIMLGKPAPATRSARTPVESAQRDPHGAAPEARGKGVITGRERGDQLRRRDGTKTSTHRVENFSDHPTSAPRLRWDKVSFYRASIRRHTVQSSRHERATEPPRSRFSFLRSAEHDCVLTLRQSGVDGIVFGPARACWRAPSARRRYDHAGRGSSRRSCGRRASAMAAPSRASKRAMRWDDSCDNPSAGARFC